MHLSSDVGPSFRVAASSFEAGICAAKPSRLENAVASCQLAYPAVVLFETPDGQQCAFGMIRKESLILLLFSLSFAAPVAKQETENRPKTTVLGTSAATIDFVTSQQVLDEALRFSQILHTYFPGYGNPYRFNGYGTGEGQYVCTTFASEIFWRAGWPVSFETWKKIQINTLEQGVSLPDLLRAGDPRMKGIVHALTSAGLGMEVSFENLQPGDWIQYWYSSGDRVKGHVVLVLDTQTLEDGLHVRVMGANESTHGVAELSLHLLDEAGNNRMVRAFAVRPLMIKKAAMPGFSASTTDPLQASGPSWLHPRRYQSSGLGALAPQDF